MKKIRLGLSAILVFAGVYVMADAWDVVPGWITMKPAENLAQPYPDPVPNELPAAPNFIADDAAPIPASAEVVAVLKSLAQSPELSGTKLRAVVIDAVTGSELANIGADQAAIPASTQKLLTTAAFLNAYGPSHRFSTRVLQEEDALYLVGGGDILLTAAKQNISAEAQTQLKAQGYGVPASLAELAEKTIAALDTSSDTGAKPSKLYLDSSLFTGPEFHESVAGAGIYDWLMPIAPIAVNEGRTADNKFSANPAENAAKELVAEFAQQGLKLEYAGLATTPDPAKELAKVESITTQEISNRILGDSDNSLAEVAAHLTAIKIGQPADYTGASAAVAAQLQKLGVPTAGFKIVDGSGLSESNRVTATGLAQLLKHFWDCTECDESRVVVGLPISGLDGTLANRYRSETGSAALGAGEIRAKTGTLLSTNSLAGYLRTNAGRPLIFTILVEGDVPEGANAAREAIDTAVAKLLTLSSGKNVELGDS